MKDREWELLTEMRQDIKEIKSEMSTLKIKVAGISAFIGGFIGIVLKKLGL